MTNNYDQQLGPFFPNLNNGKQFWPGLNYSYQYPKGTRTYVAAVNSLKHTYLVSKGLISSGALLFVCDMIRSPNCLLGQSTDKGCVYVYTCSLPLITIDNEVMNRLFIVEHRRTFINIASLHLTWSHSTCMHTHTHLHNPTWTLLYLSFLLQHLCECHFN